jgi:hypothetical protein
LLPLLLCLPGRARANEAAHGWCESGAQIVLTSGLQSTTKVQASYPACTITVYLHGSLTLAPIFQDVNDTIPLSNPFTAATNGQWIFYGVNGTHYDVQMSGAGFPTPVTYNDIYLNDSTGGGGGGGAANPAAPAFSVQTANGTVNGFVGVGPGIANQQYVSEGPSQAGTMASAGLPDATSSPVSTTPYTIQCDNTVTTLDRARLIRFQSGAVNVTVPLSTAAGCSGGFVVTVINDGAATMTFSRSGADTFSVFDGNSSTDGATFFTLTNGAYAALTQGDTGIWEVRKNGGAGSAFYQTVESNASAVTQRPILNLIAGSNMTVSCVDNSGATRSDCTLTSSATASTAWSGITAATNANAGTFVATGNTWDFTGATAFKVPVGAGAAPTANGTIAFDSTSNLPKFGSNGTTLIYPATNTAASHQFYNGFTQTSGAFSAAQPAFSDLSGSAACAQLPALTGDTTTSAGSCATTTAKINGTAFSGTTNDVVAFGASNTPLDTAILYTNLVTAASNYTSGDLIQAAGNNKTTSDSAIAAANVVQTTTVVSTIVDTASPVTVSATLAAQFHFNENATAGAAMTYNLPTAAAGKQFCISNANNGSAANTGVITIATSASGQFIIFTDGTLSATGGNVTSGGAAADSACVVGVDATHWWLTVQSGTWTKH